MPEVKVVTEELTPKQQVMEIMKTATKMVMAEITKCSAGDPEELTKALKVNKEQAAKIAELEEKLKHDPDNNLETVNQQLREEIKDKDERLGKARQTFKEQKQLIKELKGGNDEGTVEALKTEIADLKQKIFNLENDIPF